MTSQTNQHSIQSPDIHVNEDVLMPHDAVITDVISENSSIKTFVVEFSDRNTAEAFSFMPGQFVMVTVLHHGEAPISISSSPREQGYIELSIRKAGRLTSRIHELCPGDHIGLRGPFGRPFPMKETEGYDILLIAGGIGLAPLRSVIKHCLGNRKAYGNITLLYGSRTPSDIAFKRDLDEWSKKGTVEVLLSVDEAEPGWHGHEGLVTELIDKVEMEPGRIKALLCGPPVMIDAVARILGERGVERRSIITTLERNMKCGVGLCGHCHMNGVLICRQGPVFDMEQLEGLREP